MRIRLILLLLILETGAAGVASAALPVELELATERGVQITAPQEWLQLLAGIGIENVRIRGARPGDVPKAENRGSAARPRFYVLGLLTSRDQLQLPGGTFSRGARGQIRDYFEGLAADGAESVTAARGMFNLTEAEIKAVFADLSQPVGFDTNEQKLPALLDQFRQSFQAELIIDPQAERALAAAAPTEDQVRSMTAGTGLALLLRREGLLLRPQKVRGQPLAYVIAAGAPPAGVRPGAPDANSHDRPGKPGDSSLQSWPVGWELSRTPGETAPSLFEYLNAEIDGYTLEEALAAIAPRIKVPLHYDHAALMAHKIDPADVQVRLARTRTFYKRVLDRVCSQARLGAQLRVDEAGRPFLWITR